MRIGLVPVSAKPYHAGHHALITMASNENDKVKLFVSTSDRKRKGQFEIHGVDMIRVWQEELEKIMPGNVEIVYGGSPVKKVWETLQAAEADPGNQDTYVVYSDPVDTAQNYSEPQLEKYCGDLRSGGHCILAAEENPSAFTRGEGTPNISGTAVREMLKAGNTEAFAAAMPAGVNSQNIFNILTGGEVQQESLLRTYIRNTILVG
jgi:hypothetical protein